MSVSDKTNVVVQKYLRTQYPVLDEGIRRYFQDELQRIEIAIGTACIACVLKSAVDDQVCTDVVDGRSAGSADGGQITIGRW